METSHIRLSDTKHPPHPEQLTAISRRRRPPGERVGHIQTWGGGGAVSYLVLLLNHVQSSYKTPFLNFHICTIS